MLNIAATILSSTNDIFIWKLSPECSSNWFEEEAVVSLEESRKCQVSALIKWNLKSPTNNFNSIGKDILPRSKYSFDNHKLRERKVKTLTRN